MAKHSLIPSPFLNTIVLEKRQKLISEFERTAVLLSVKVGAKNVIELYRETGISCRKIYNILTDLYNSGKVYCCHGKYYIFE